MMTDNSDNHWKYEIGTAVTYDPPDWARSGPYPGDTGVISARETGRASYEEPAYLVALDKHTCTFAKDGIVVLPQKHLFPTEEYALMKATQGVQRET